MESSIEQARRALAMSEDDGETRAALDTLGAKLKSLIELLDEEQAKLARELGAEKGTGAG